MEEIHNPYAAPGAPLIPELPPLPSTGRPELAGRGLRLAAKIIDRLLYAACFLPFIVLALAQTQSAAGGMDWGVSLSLLLTLAALLGLFIYNLALLGQHGQSVAKRWFGIRIVRSDGSAADLGRILGLRMFLPWLIALFVGPLFVLPDLLCIFGAEQRCLHDLMADTIVVSAWSSPPGSGAT